MIPRIHGFFVHAWDISTGSLKVWKVRDVATQAVPTKLPAALDQILRCMLVISAWAWSWDPLGLGDLKADHQKTLVLSIQRSMAPGPWWPTNSSLSFAGGCHRKAWVILDRHMTYDGTRPSIRTWLVCTKKVGARPVTIRWLKDPALDETALIDSQTALSNHKCRLDRSLCDRAAWSLAAFSLDSFQCKCQALQFPLSVLQPSDQDLVSASWWSPTLPGPPASINLEIQETPRPRL